MKYWIWVNGSCRKGFFTFWGAKRHADKIIKWEKKNEYDYRNKTIVFRKEIK